MGSRPPNIDITTSYPRTTTQDWWPTTQDWWTTTQDWWPTTQDWRTTTQDWWTTTQDWWTTTQDWWTTTTADPFPGEGCPIGWVDSIEGCFLFHYTKATTWGEAQFECEKVGGFLAEPKTEEQAGLLKSLAFLEYSILGVGSWWIGLSDQSHEARWIWQHSASDMDYSDWAPGSPSYGVNNKDCAMLDVKDSFAWTDRECFESLAPPICQRDGEGTTTTPPTDSPTSTADYCATVELVGGRVDEYFASGNVYTYNSRGYFGPVCDDSWGYNEADIVCRQLGYNYGSPTSNSYFGNVNSSFAMDDVNCYGNEECLQYCKYNTTDNCSRNEGAGVKCYNYVTTGTYPPWTTWTTWWREENN